jgi:predicted amidohydrolase YtcJ
MENALTREETIKGWQFGLLILILKKRKKGSLEVGKWADFVMYDKDIMKKPIEILGMKPSNTYLKN